MNFCTRKLGEVTVFDALNKVKQRVVETAVRCYKESLCINDVDVSLNSVQMTRVVSRIERDNLY